MPKPNRIPLFPLDVVLLPYMPIPLHIFEPRYKIMVRRCLDDKIEFGMVLAANQSAAGVGCTAEIVEKVRDYSDGRMDILAEGRDVFRLDKLLDEKEYYEGQVEYLADGPFLPDADRESKLLQGFEECRMLLTGRGWSGPTAQELPILAYRLAAQLPVELETRQALLEMRSEANRRALLLNWIGEFLPKLKQRQQTAQRSSGNGHGSYIN